MNWNKWVRQIHRWMSMTFTAGVMVYIVALAAGGGQEQPPVWMGLLALVPLILLLFTGLYLFVLPHATKWRSARVTAARPR